MACDSKLYQGVRKRNTKWVAEIKDPIKKRRLWLGTYVTAEEASNVYQSKKIELEAKVMALIAKKGKRTNTIVVSCDSRRKSLQESVERSVEAEVSKLETQAASGSDEVVGSELSTKSCYALCGERSNVGCSVMRQFFPASTNGNFIVEYGPVVINNHGFILGEFSWLDDLSIHI